MEYQIAEDVRGNKYYFAKDAMQILNVFYNLNHL